MSDCDICMTADYDGFCEEYDLEIVIADADLTCYECRKAIPAGDRYELLVAIWEGESCKIHTCLICADVANNFYCDGRMHGDLWEDMRENVFEHLTMSSKCFRQLSAAAKTVVLEKWNEWLRWQ